MPRVPHRPPQLVGRIFRGSAAIERGLLTRKQLYGSAWRRVFHDVYVDAEVPDTHALRCRAAGLILPAGSAVTGRSAACLQGLPLGRPHEPVQVLAPSTSRCRAKGLRIHHGVLPAAQVLPGPPPVTVPARTAWEIAREPDSVEAVAALDVLLSHRYVSSQTLAAWAAAKPRSGAAAAIRLADARAESPQESRTRVRLVRAGFPAPLPQYIVRADGTFVARVDLAWPAVRVAVEYDGAWHGNSEQFRRDRARLNRLTEAGWTVPFVTAQDLADPERFGRFCAQLAAALRR